MKIILIFLLVLVLMPSAYGYESCVNSTHRMMDDNIMVNGVPIRINQSVAEYCPYGCAGGKCLPSGGNDTLSLAVIFAVIIFSFIYLGVNLPQENAFLSWVFIPMGIIFMVVGLFFVALQSIFNEQINEMLAWISYSILIILISLIAYFFIYLIYNSMKKVFPYSPKS